MLDDPDHVRTQIMTVLSQIKWFYFDCNLVVGRKIVIASGAALRLKPLYEKLEIETRKGSSRLISR